MAGSEVLLMVSCHKLTKLFFLLITTKIKPQNSKKVLKAFLWSLSFWSLNWVTKTCFGMHFIITLSSNSCRFYLYNNEYAFMYQRTVRISRDKEILKKKNSSSYLWSFCYFWIKDVYPRWFTNEFEVFPTVKNFS